MTEKQKLDNGLLRESIAHWERMRDGNRIASEEPGTEDCALCRVYYKKGCSGCPIRIRTGMPMCCGTPYGKAWEIWETEMIGYDSEEWIAAAQAMIDFLKSLIAKES